MEYVSTQIFMKCYSKQCTCINNYQIHSWPKIEGLMTFEAKKSINLISKSGCLIQHALKINKQCS